MLLFSSSVFCQFVCAFGWHCYFFLGRCCCCFVHSLCFRQFPWHIFFLFHTMWNVSFDAYDELSVWNVSTVWITVCVSGVPFLSVGSNTVAVVGFPSKKRIALSLTSTQIHTHKIYETETHRHTIFSLSPSFELMSSRTPDTAIVYVSVRICHFAFYLHCNRNTIPMLWFCVVVLFSRMLFIWHEQSVRSRDREREEQKKLITASFFAHHHCISLLFNLLCSKQI